MDEETKNWTSLDLYYKGFHIKKSWGENISRVTLMAEIDGLITAGFKPSWNDETNKATQSPVVAPQSPTVSPAAQNINIGVNGHLLDKYNSKYPDSPLDDKQIWDLTHPCKKCGAEKFFNPKKGTIVCSAFCWTK